jgi:hypothetical protein
MNEPAWAGGGKKQGILADALFCQTSWLPDQGIL